MAIKMPTIEIFMDSEDEIELSNRILEVHPEVKFIDVFPWDDPCPPIYSGLQECKSQYGNIAIVNTEITSLEDYCANFVKKRFGVDVFDGGIIGPGIIQYLRPRFSDYNPNGLRNGRLASSFDSEKEPETASFSKSIYSIFKKGAKKLYWINPESGLITDPKPDRHFFAWPSAIKKYDRVNGQYLSNHAQAFLTSKKNA